MEKILNKKKKRGVEKYLVWWKGFTAERDTWERIENLKNAKEAIKKSRKNRYSRGKGLQKGGTTREVYGKNVVWVE